MPVPNVNADQVGAERTYQDPNDAVKKSTGTYDDPASRLSETERLPNLPKVETPNPFGPLRGA
jgi:hypothetical protein